MSKTILAVLLLVIIVNANALSISTEDELRIDQEKGISTSIMIGNDAAQSTTASLSCGNESNYGFCSNVMFENKIVPLEAKSTKDVVMVVSVPAGTGAGEKYAFTITVTDGIGNSASTIVTGAVVQRQFWKEWGRSWIGLYEFGNIPAPKVLVWLLLGLLGAGISWLVLLGAKPEARNIVMTMTLIFIIILASFADVAFGATLQGVLHGM